MGATTSGFELRQQLSLVSDLFLEGGKPVDRVVRRVAVAAVIANPLAGRWADDLSVLMEFGEQLGKRLVEQALALLGGPAESFGKAAIVGERGELEHAAALLHPRLGAPVRDGLGGGKALIPSAKKRGGPGTAIDVPLNHKDAAKVRSHFDAIEVCVPDAPASDEIVVILALSRGGRPHPRVGGLTVDQIVGEDGLS